MSVELVIGLGLWSYALSYYLATARVFQAPRTRINNSMEARAKQLALDAQNTEGWERKRLGRTATFIEFWRSMIACRKCWPQWSSWIGLCFLAGPPWGWTGPEFVSSLAAAGLALWAYENGAGK